MKLTLSTFILGQYIHFFTNDLLCKIGIKTYLDVLCVSLRCYVLDDGHS